MALITEDTLRAMPLGIRDADWAKIDGASGYLATLIDTASEQVENYCERVLEARNVTEIVRGMDHTSLLLHEYPVNEVVSIEWTDDFSQTGTEDPSAFRILKGGIIQTTDRSYFLKERIYTVTYNAGFTPVPFTLQHATALWVTELMQPQFAGAQREAAAIIALSSEQITELLAKYRRTELR